MWSILVAVVAPRTGKSLKMSSAFLKEEKIFVTKWILHFVFKLNQSSEIVLQG